MTREQLKQEVLQVLTKKLTADDITVVILADLIARMDKYIDELEEGWRDIETAPMEDETRIILYAKQPNKEDSVFEGYYYSTELGYDDMWCDASGQHVIPTHWKPLPQPPKQGA